MKTSLNHLVVTRFLVAWLAIVLLAVAASATGIDTVAVGNLGNAADGTGYGAVNYAYNIGKFEVTAGEYSDFLNAVAATDRYGLYDPRMLIDEMGCKIQRHGSPGAYTYSVDPDWMNRPVNYVSWGDAARFCNWLHNGQPQGLQNAATTEDGAYRLGGATREEDLTTVLRRAHAKWFLPRADEWYKAAYHRNDGNTGNYYRYPTNSDAAPQTPVSTTGEEENQASSSTFNADGSFGLGSPYFRTEVGQHKRAASPYGTFDQGGNVWEWTEPFRDIRYLRGGSFGRTADNMLSSQYLAYNLTDADASIGFRVASNPELLPTSSEESRTSERILLSEGAELNAVSQAVLFGFDPLVFPMREDIVVKLIPGTNAGRVLEPGPAGAADEYAMYYGTVIRVGDEFRMWYSSSGMPNFACYAVSKDGIHWDKLRLGLVEFKGSKQNNIIPFPFHGTFTGWVIRYDADELEPDRRFKLMANVLIKNEHHVCVAFSPDGIHWMPAEARQGFFEVAGVTKYRDEYYLSGQAGLPRKMCTWTSKDFVHWAARGVAFEREHLPCPEPDDEVPIYPDGEKYPGGALDKEQIHCGAGLWNRGNVVVGVYGQWHGRPIDRRRVSIDLGLVVSHDGLKFVEPIENFALMDASDAPIVPKQKAPALMQGQGMENVGDKTYCWYGYWHVDSASDSGVCLATWERDRLGFMTPSGEHPYVVSQPIEIPRGRFHAYVNAGNLDEHNRLRISLVGSADEPIEGFSGDDAAVVTESGLSVPVHWPNAAKAAPRDVRVRVDFEGPEPKLYAIYLDAMVGAEGESAAKNTDGNTSDPKPEIIGRNLLLDTRVVDQAEGAVLVPGQVDKHPSNPLFGEDKLWEPRYDNMYATVIYDPDEQLYKCWYTPFIASELDENTPREERKNVKWNVSKRRYGLCYAVSRDGLHWEKPDLGLLEFRGSTKNNIQLFDVHGADVIKDSRETDPDKRYKMFGTMGGAGPHIAWLSPDGLHWGEPKFQNLGGRSDTHNNVFWHPQRMQYVGITRYAFQPRTVGRTESENFIDWLPVQEVLVPTADEPHFHDMVAFPYENICLGLIGVFDVKADRQWVELAWSPDSVEWHRISPGTPFIPNGAKEADYDWGCIFAARPIIGENDIRLYYASCNGKFFDWRDGFLCLATLPKDRWAGYRCDGPGEGTVLTQPLLCHTENLAVTAEATNGAVTIEVLDETGAPITKSEELTGDLTDAPVSWKSDARLQSVINREVRLRFRVRNATIYSFAFAK